MARSCTTKKTMESDDLPPFTQLIPCSRASFGVGEKKIAHGPLVSHPTCQHSLFLIFQNGKTGLGEHSARTLCPFNHSPTLLPPGGENRGNWTVLSKARKMNGSRPLPKSERGERQRHWRRALFWGAGVAAFPAQETPRNRNSPPLSLRKRVGESTAVGESLSTVDC